jgi:hypothetical protein
MSFQGYLDTIKEKTGMTPADFEKAAREKGLLDPPLKASEITKWLKDDYGLGYGHAGAIYKIFKDQSSPKLDAEGKVAKHFTGGRAHWRASYDKIYAKAETFGDDVGVQPAAAYISLTRNKKKFAIITCTADRMDVGIKLKGEPFTPRYKESGKWNAMVTHRVQITDAREVNAELLGWLKRAYQAAG